MKRTFYISSMNAITVSLKNIYFDSPSKANDVNNDNKDDHDKNNTNENDKGKKRRITTVTT